MNPSQDDTTKALPKLQGTSIATTKPGEPRNGWFRGALSERLSPGQQLNTNLLGRRVAGDAVAAGAAGVLVAPLITIIDKAIIENTTGRNTIMESAKQSLRTALLRPHNFFLARPFALILTLYGGTYLAANTVDTVSSTLADKPPSHSTSGAAKFAATSSTNLSLCLYKDSQFTKLFGAGGAANARPIPNLTFALFAIRDSLTMFASFNLPPMLAPQLPIGAEVERYVSRTSCAQFLAPAAMQALSTPMHLLGLDLYNRADGVDLRDRLRRVWRDWGKSFVARIGRIVPAFGVGGVVNTGVRRWWMEALED
ncbi:MAG: hypothetical protein M1828_005985 [Chrysothrix sp. TS-e1954]|nr:MAG: hypothetical protein M1828_005985 [Chrysothrix sp. TS-e1954]